MSTLIEARRRDCEARLSKITEEIAGNSLYDEPRLSVFCTGSMGRRDGWNGPGRTGSDLDLVLLFSEPDKSVNLEFETRARVTADLVDINERHGFPTFDGNGRYLNVHHSGSMQEALGGNDDDHTHDFTARILMLCESFPITEKTAFYQALERVVSFYFVDYEKHRDDFRPDYLVNDLLRFWRTLCLNYENRRQRKLRAAEERSATADGRAGVDVARGEAKIKNLKLRFSRATTVYSMVIPISAQGPPVGVEDVLRLAAKTPLERLVDLGAELGGKVEASVGEVLRGYEWFLDFTGRPDEEILEALADRSLRNDAKERSWKYGDDLVSLIKLAVPADRLRVLLV